MVRSSKYRLAALALLPPVLAPSLISGARGAMPDDLFNRYFANVLDGRPCYARTYDDAHLAAHSQQRVRQIEIDLSSANPDGSPNAADRFEIGFALMLKSSPEWYGQAASCKTGNDAFECYLESDGGIFRLTPSANGGLRLETGDSGIAIEGSNDVAELSGTSGDDRVFDLRPSKQECEDAAAFFAGGND
jgi:hypothetical protein